MPTSDAPAMRSSMTRHSWSRKCDFSSSALITPSPRKFGHARWNVASTLCNRLPRRV
jgi:hypothetical protein